MYESPILDRTSQFDVTLTLGDQELEALQSIIKRMLYAENKDHLVNVNILNSLKAKEAQGALNSYDLSNLRNTENVVNRRGRFISNLESLLSRLR